MIKFASEVVGANVILFQERVNVGTVKELVIDPGDGAFLGILVFDPLEKKPKSIPATEIKGMGLGFVLVKDLNSLTELDDVVKIKKALGLGAKIFKEKVETESGQTLGKVEDFTVSLKYLSLDKLYIASSSPLSFLSPQLIIALSKIVRIEKKKIIVSDEYVKNKNLEPGIAPMPMPE